MLPEISLKNQLIEASRQQLLTAAIFKIMTSGNIATETAITNNSVAHSMVDGVTGSLNNRYNELQETARRAWS